MNLFSVLIISGVVQGGVLFFALMRLKRGYPDSNRFLAKFMLLIMLVMTGRYFYTIEPMTLLTAKVLFAGDMIIFLFGPLLYFYLMSLFGIKHNSVIPVWVHYVPQALFIVIIFPLLIADKEGYISYYSKTEWVFRFVEIFAILQIIFYLELNRRLLREYEGKLRNQISALPALRIYKIILLVSAALLGVWLFSFIMRVTNPLGAGDYLGYQLVWFALPCSVIALGYYSLINPDILRVESVAEAQNIKEDKLPNAAELKEKVIRIMENDKPYLQPKLTLPELAEKCNMSTHLLSRVINEEFGKNFFEFVNQYRVEEFKNELKEEENKNLTILALAYKAGFNSKTTFNTAFRSITGQTPREFHRILRNQS
ncbi:MAG: helix-turn-helix transcriptional regulator [Ignavibacteriaceae bacterium]|nr:helix-turn-helix transcriptional regulator [Ignavibacteriaceae bacterium]